MPHSSTLAGPDPLRGVIVGLGTMGSHHLRILDSWSEVKVVAVVEQDRGRLQAALGMHPAVRGHESLEQALGEHELDFACLAVPVGALPACTRAALDAGLHA